MLRLIALAYCFAAAISVASAAPLVLYKPATGEFWLTGTQQPFRNTAAASLELRSGSERLVEARSDYGVMYPLDLSDFEWHRGEVNVMVPTDYGDPYYVGPFTSPGTPTSDLSASFHYVSLRPRFHLAEAIPIKTIPEPGTSLLVRIGFLAAIGSIRANRARA